MSDSFDENQLRLSAKRLRKKKAEQQAARAAHYATIINARTMGLSVSAIATLSGMSRRMVKNVLDMDAQRSEA